MYTFVAKNRGRKKTFSTAQYFKGKDFILSLLVNKNHDIYNYLIIYKWRKLMLVIPRFLHIFCGYYDRYIHWLELTWSSLFITKKLIQNKKFWGNDQNPLSKLSETYSDRFKSFLYYFFDIQILRKCQNAYRYLTILVDILRKMSVRGWTIWIL